MMMYALSKTEMENYPISISRSVFNKTVLIMYDLKILRTGNISIQSLIRKKKRLSIDYSKTVSSFTCLESSLHPHLFIKLSTLSHSNGQRLPGIIHQYFRVKNNLSDMISIMHQLTHDSITHR